MPQYPIKGVARGIRKLWQLPDGPIRNLIDTIERAGGVVFPINESIKVDGISQWPIDANDRPPVFFFNSNFPGDRQRWTLAHEIGHMLMHHLPSTCEEDEADQFAGEFLMPEDEIKDDLAGLTLKHAAALKGYWKVSMQSLIYRAKTLGQISKDRYSRLFKELTAKGYRKCEPVPIPQEVPELFPELVKVFQSSGRRDNESVKEFLGLNDEEFNRDYWFLSGPRLRVV